DALDLVAVGNVDVVVIAPGPANAAMLDCGAVISHLELIDQSVDLVGFAARGDQHGVHGRYHDHVLESDHGCQHRVLRAHEAVATLQHEHRTVGDIAGVVVIEQLPHRPPAADAGPAKIDRHHRRELSTLHNRVIDRFYGR